MSGYEIGLWSRPNPSLTGSPSDLWKVCPSSLTFRPYFSYFLGSAQVPVKVLQPNNSVKIEV